MLIKKHKNTLAYSSQQILISTNVSLSNKMHSISGATSFGLQKEIQLGIVGPGGLRRGGAERDVGSDRQENPDVPLRRLHHRKNQKLQNVL